MVIMIIQHKAVQWKSSRWSDSYWSTICK